MPNAIIGVIAPHEASVGSVKILGILAKDEPHSGDRDVAIRSFVKYELFINDEGKSEHGVPATIRIGRLRSEEGTAREYSLVGFNETPLDSETSFLHAGLRLIEQQRSFSAAEDVARRIAETVIWTAGPNIVELLRTARSGTAAFADLIAAIGTVDLGNAKPNIRDYLIELRNGSDPRIAQSAEDALDLLDFADE